MTETSFQMATWNFVAMGQRFAAQPCSSSTTRCGCTSTSLAEMRIGAICQSDMQGFVQTLESKELAAGRVRNIYETARTDLRDSCRCQG
jgi:hypothetical protein